MPELEYPDPPLAGDGVALRPWQDSDIGPLVALVDGDQAIDRFTMVPQPYRPQDARGWFARSRRERLAGTALAFALVDEDGGELLGSIDLRIPDWDSLVAEIGYLVAAEARGRGAAPAAVRLLAGWGFEAVGLERIEIYAEPGNAASRRVAEKAGFECEGLLKSKRRTRHGRSDMYVYARVA